MSKYTILIPIILPLVIFFVSPRAAIAASITPAPIGDFNVNEPKSITVSGLDTDTTYGWVESKITSITPIIRTKNYSRIYLDCFDSNNTGQIVTDLGPYSTPGLYRLEIFEAKTGDTCLPFGNPIVSQDFSVGGHINSPTGKPCCSNLFASFYDKDKDACKKDLFDIPGPPSPRFPTDCSNEGSFCEPESEECFQTKTLVIRGKICKNPQDPDFNKDKHIECGSGGGQFIQGCSDAKDPNDPSKPNSNPGIATAIGCIHTSPTELIKDLLKFVVGISGGLAFLMMLLGAFQMLTSAGNPETLSAGKDRLTSAVIGLLFVIFAILLLQIIGVDILKIPGFGR